MNELETQQTNDDKGEQEDEVRGTSSVVELDTQQHVHPSQGPHAKDVSAENSERLKDANIDTKVGDDKEGAGEEEQPGFNVVARSLLEEARDRHENSHLHFFSQPQKKGEDSQKMGEEFATKDGVPSSLGADQTQNEDHDHVLVVPEPPATSMTRPGAFPTGGPPTTSNTRSTNGASRVPEPEEPQGRERMASSSVNQNTQNQPDEAPLIEATLVRGETVRSLRDAASDADNDGRSPDAPDDHHDDQATNNDDERTKVVAARAVGLRDLLRNRRMQWFLGGFLCFIILVMTVSFVAALFVAQQLGGGPAPEPLSNPYSGPSPTSPPTCRRRRRMAKTIRRQQQQIQEEGQPVLDWTKEFQLKFEITNGLVEEGRMNETQLVGFEDYMERMHSLYLPPEVWELIWVQCNVLGQGYTPVDGDFVAFTVPNETRRSMQQQRQPETLQFQYHFEMRYRSNSFRANLTDRPIQLRDYVNSSTQTVCEGLADVLSVEPRDRVSTLSMALQQQTNQRYALFYHLDGRPTGDGLFQDASQISRFAWFMQNLTSTFPPLLLSSSNDAEKVDVTTICEYASQTSFDLPPDDLPTPEPGAVFYSQLGTRRRRTSLSQRQGDAPLNFGRTTYGVFYDMSFVSYWSNVSNYTTHYENAIYERFPELAQGLREWLNFPPESNLTLQGVYVLAVPPPTIAPSTAPATRIPTTETPSSIPTFTPYPTFQANVTVSENVEVHVALTGPPNAGYMNESQEYYFCSQMERRTARFAPEAVARVQTQCTFFIESLVVETFPVTLAPTTTSWTRRLWQKAFRSQKPTTTTTHESNSSSSPMTSQPQLSHEASFPNGTAGASRQQPNQETPFRLRRPMEAERQLQQHIHATYIYPFRMQYTSRSENVANYTKMFLYDLIESAAWFNAMLTETLGVNASNNLRIQQVTTFSITTAAPTHSQSPSESPTQFPTLPLPTYFPTQQLTIPNPPTPEENDLECPEE